MDKTPIPAHYWDFTISLSWNWACSLPCWVSGLACSWLSLYRNLQFWTWVLEWEFNCSREVSSWEHPGEQGIWDSSAVPVPLQATSILANIELCEFGLMCGWVDHPGYPHSSACLLYHCIPTNTSAAPWEVTMSYKVYVWDERCVMLAVTQSSGVRTISSSDVEHGKYVAASTGWLWSSC